jgi:hypothetical protein
VEGARPADGHPLPHAAAGEDALDPVFHFLAGAPGKGEEQDAARIGALLDEIRDPMRKRLSFAGTRPRDDQQGAAARAIVRGGGLVFVEGCKTLGWLHGFELRTIPKLKMIMIRSCPPCHTPQPAGRLRAIASVVFIASAATSMATGMRSSRRGVRIYRFIGWTRTTERGL